MEAILLSTAEAKSPDAATFLVKDTVRRVAEEEQELRDYAGVPVDRDEIAKRPAMPEDGPLLLDSGDGDGEARAKGDGGGSGGFCKADGTGPPGCDASGGGMGGTFGRLKSGREGGGSVASPARWGWEGPDADDVSTPPTASWCIHQHQT